MRGWNPGGRGAKSSWMRLDSEAQAMVKVGIVKLSYVYAANGTVTDEDVDGCVIAENGTTIEMLMDDADVPDYMKCQIGGSKINPGKGVNKRKCIDMTNPQWLAQERIHRAQVRADPSLPKQIYGKDFDPSQCKCECVSRQVGYHSQTRKHNSHVAAIVARLRADSGCVLDNADEGVKLARAWVVKHPSADPVENAPGVVDHGVEASAPVQVIVEITLEQASREVDGALDGGNGGFGLIEVDENVDEEGDEDESDGEEYDEDAVMD
jgi:hypothetical protein